MWEDPDGRKCNKVLNVNWGERHYKAHRQARKSNELQCRWSGCCELGPGAATLDHYKHHYETVFCRWDLGGTDGVCGLQISLQDTKAHFTEHAEKLNALNV